MEEINFSKTTWNVRLFIYGCVFCICSAVAVDSLYFVIKTVVNHTHDKNIVYGIVGVILPTLFAKDLLEGIIALLRFYNLRIEILRDKLILRTKTKKCEIPMTKDTNVVCCMGGWLISWPSEKGQDIILLPRVLLGDPFLELCFYFQENTNYIPSQSIIVRSRFGFPVGGLDLDYYQPNADYIAAKEDEKKLLKSLQINKWNRLKYIKWPS
jgi:hypothetical protein